MKSIWLVLIAALVATGAHGAQPRADEPKGEADWYVVAAEDGAVIGHASEEIIASPGGRVIVGRQQVSLREPGSPTTVIFSRSTTSEDANGRTVSITSYSQTGASWTRNEARIEGDTARVDHRTGSSRRVVDVALPPGVRFDTGAALLKAWDPAVQPRLEFDSFDVDDMAVERIVIEAMAGGARDAEGRVSALRKRYDGDQLMAAARLQIDRRGRIVSVVQPMSGTTITIKATDRRTALAPHQPHRLLASVMTKSPFRISDRALSGHIRYRFAFRDGIAFAPPQTGEQRTTANAEGAVLDICAACGPGLPTTPEYLAQSLKPTVWLESDHPRLKAIAAPIARTRVDDARKMRLLLEAARPYLGRVDFAGHFSALETLSRRAGDCSEAANLLAALGRSAGIPTRVVNGLVYSRQRYHGVSNAWMPHSWTLAYVDGKWRSFDLALDAFDASHIALSVGDGDARSAMAASQLASLLRWEDMAEVRTRPAT